MQFCKTLVHLAQLPCLEAAVACIQSMLKRFWPHPIVSFQWGSREKEEIGWVKTLSSGGAVVQLHLAKLPCLEAAVTCMPSKIKRIWPHSVISVGRQGGEGGDRLGKNVE